MFDEAILLADHILLMSHGPCACIAEIVVNTLPRPRRRQALHCHASYYPLRNHIIEFLARDAPPPPAADASGRFPDPPTIWRPCDDQGRTDREDPQY